MRPLYLASLLVSTACARGAGSDFVRDQYTKSEYQIPMRDGVRLFTTVYVPKDASDAKRYPILLKRTPFSVAPYGDAYAKLVGPNAYVMHDKYIFVYQDIRGRYMSEGKFVIMRPFIADSIKARDPKATDEASDAYDTIAWLLAHVPHTNGRVGQWGTSYAGFLGSMGALSRHPALVVSSPQAPATDSYFEDFHHNGALTQGYFYGYPVFGIYPPGPTTSDWWVPKMVTDGTANDYAFQLALGPLKNTTEKYYKDNWFWQDIVAHPNYDTYWQSRAVPPDLTGIHHALLIAGGWFDAENLYGTLATYKALKARDSAASVHLVMGPWRHNGWELRDVVHTVHGDIYFGDSLETKFQRDVEAPYFRAYLKGDEKTDLPAALLFDTGRKQWRNFSSWPAHEATTRRYYFRADSSLSPRVPTEAHAALSYVSDPLQPVPSRCTGQTIEDGTLYRYMSDDQRCYVSRSDVVTFATTPLPADVTLGGEIRARLNVSTTGTDADYVVKLIDVYPATDSVNAGYAQLVRGEIMRARFRRSFAEPQPMRPDAITPVAFPLQDVLHTFRAGHRIMVQVQSTWFPAFDRNPQTYVPNIYQADAVDFVKATERIWVDRVEPSYLEVQVVNDGAN
jgi:putative CocE/NonD family hydrolase